MSDTDPNSSRWHNFDNDGPPSLGRRLVAWCRRRRWLLTSLAGLGLLSYFIAVPAWRRYRENKALFLIESATIVAQNGDSAAAEERIKRARSLFYMSVPIERALANHYRIIGEPQAMAFYRDLISARKVGTDEDERRLVELALKWKQPLQAAEEALRHLKSDATLTDPQWLALCSRWLIAENQVSEAANLIAKARLAMGEKAATDPLFQLTDARLELEGATVNAAGIAPSSWATAVAQLLNILKPGTAVYQNASTALRHEAAQLLAGRLLSGPGLRSVVNPSQAEELAVALDALAQEEEGPNPHHGDEDRLAAAGIRLLIDGNKKAQIFDQLRNFYIPQATYRQLALARWFARFNFLQEAVEWAERNPSVLSNSNWLLNHLDALAGLGRWLEIDQWLAESKRPADISKHVAALFLVRSGMAQKLPQDSLDGRIKMLTSALESANANELAYAAWNLEQTGSKDLAFKLFESVSKAENLAAVGLRGMLRCKEFRDTTPLIDIMRRLLKAQPQSPEVQNDFAYLILLENKAPAEELKAAAEKATQLAKEAPKYLAFRTTAALAALRTGHPQDAQAAYADLTLDWKTIPPTMRAIRAITLAQNLRSDEAKELAATIDKSKLRIPEAEWLTQLGL